MSQPHRTVYLPKALIEAALLGTAPRPVTLPEHANGVPITYSFCIRPDCAKDADPIEHLHLDHLRALAVILSLEQRKDGCILTDTHTFARTYATDRRMSCAAKDSLGNLLLGLNHVWCRQTLHGSKVDEDTDFQILGEFSATRGTNRETGRLCHRRWQDIRLTRLFREMVFDLRGYTQPIFIPAFLGLRSDIAAKLYLYCSGPAFHRTLTAPMRIATETLWQKLGITTPSSKYVSKRVQILTQHEENSILNQVDGRLVGKGDVKLRLRLAQEDDHDDAILYIWGETHAKPSEQPLTVANEVGKFRRAWLETGGDNHSYVSRMRARLELDAFDLEQLQAAKIEVSQCRAALKIAKALLEPGDWLSLLGEAKGEIAEMSSKPKDHRARKPTGLLLYRLEQAVRFSSFGKPNPERALAADPVS